MSKLEEVQQVLSERVFDDTTIDVYPEVSRAYKISFKMSNFHTSHLELIKQYPVKFEPQTKTHSVNLWVFLDLLLPKMNIPRKNVFIPRKVLQVKDQVENEELIGTRPPQKDLFVTDPLKGKPPYENFQIDALKNSIAKGFYGLLLKQGTGKSYIIASTLRYLYKYKDLHKTIICTPGTGLIDIKRKLQAFAPDTFNQDNVKIIDKDTRNCFDEEYKQYTTLVMTYNTLRLVKQHYKDDKSVFLRAFQKWSDRKTTALVCDEGHKIANASAQRSTAAHELASVCEYRYLSTGTPADKPDKYYSILKFIHPYFVRYLGKSDWIKSVANLGTAFSQFEVSEYRPEDLRYFLDSASSHYVNLQDTDCLDLPKDRKKMVPIELASGLQKRIYETFSSMQLDILKQDIGALHPRQVLNKFPYLLLTLDNPDLLKKKDSAWYTQVPDDEGYVEVTRSLEDDLQKFDFGTHHQKVDYIKELLRDHVTDKGEKVIIWTGHPETADKLGMMLNTFNKRKKKTLVIHGQSKKKGYNRDELKDHVVQTFINDPDHKIMVASYLVLDTALDITAATAQIYFDLPYQLTNFDQSYKRIHRSGQTKEVTSYFLVFADTIDETRYNIILNKKQIDTKGLDSSMPLEEWKQLFTGDIPQSLDASIEEGQNLF